MLPSSSSSSNLFLRISRQSNWSLRTVSSTSSSRVPVAFFSSRSSSFPMSSSGSSLKRSKVSRVGTAERRTAMVERHFTQSASSMRSSGLASEAGSGGGGGIAAESPSSIALREGWVRPTSQQSLRILTLDRQKALNSLNLEMVAAIKDQLQIWEHSETCGLVVIRGEGPKAMCAGGDVVSLVKAICPPLSSDPNALSLPEPELKSRLSQSPKDSHFASMNFFRTEYEVNSFLSRMRKPVMAIMDGITMGGGVGLSGHNPFRIATEKTVLAMPETNIGLFPDVGGSFFLSRLDGQLGLYLGLTGEQLKGYQVYQAGIASHFVRSEDIPALLERLSELELPFSVPPGARPKPAPYPIQSKWPSMPLDRLVNSGAPQLSSFDSKGASRSQPKTPSEDPKVPDWLSLKLIDSTIREFETKANDAVGGGPEVDALKKGQELELVGDKRSAIDDIFGRAERMEDIMSGLERFEKEKEAEKPELAQWAKKTREGIEARSPTSCKVWFNAYRKGKTMDIDSVFQQDFQLAATCSTFDVHPDFTTGVSSLLIQKSKLRPNWQPPTLSAVNENKLQQNFFSPESPGASQPPLDLSKGTLDSYVLYPHKDFSLPSERVIQGYVTGEIVGRSGDYAPTREDVVRDITSAWENKQGVKEKIIEVLNRKTTLESENGTVAWNYDNASTSD